MPWNNLPEKPPVRNVPGWGTVVPLRKPSTVEGWTAREFTKWLKQLGLAGAGTLQIARFESYNKQLAGSGAGSLQIATSFPSFAPVTTQVTVAGAFNYTIPWWATKVDVILLGGGAGASGGVGAFVAGVEGHAGKWATRTLVRGVDFAVGATTLSGVVGAAGAGGPGAVANTGQIYGTKGGNTTCTTVGLTAIGGEAADAIGDVGNGWSTGGAGQSPSNIVFGGITYVGGAVQNTNGGAGNAPGGGGKGGAGGAISGNNGGAGSRGQAWFRAYQ